MKTSNLSNFLSEFWKEKFREFGDFNRKLFERLNIICKSVHYDEEFQCWIDGGKVSLAELIRLDLVGACGGISLGIDKVDINLKSRSFWNDVIDIIENSDEYKRFLYDIDFGSIKKSDLFNRINNDIVLASNFSMGLQYSCIKDRFSCFTDRFYISSIENTFDEDDNMHIVNFKGNFIGIDELDISISTNDVTRILSCIYNKLYEITELLYDDCGGLVYEPDSRYIMKPESTSEILKYQDYVGFGFTEVYYNEEEIISRYTIY